MITNGGVKHPIQHRLFVGGRFVDATDGATLTTLNPHDNSPISDVAMAGREDADRAVAAATGAQPAWARLSASERGRLLLKLAARIEDTAGDLARLESLARQRPGGVVHPVER
jgi:acyl-CoA reductase-like NAD-dependent aldehyde dehydrogenase